MTVQDALDRIYAQLEREFSITDFESIEDVLEEVLDDVFEAGFQTGAEEGYNEGWGDFQNEDCEEEDD